MSRDKQIEELAEIISSSKCTAITCSDCEFEGKPGCFMMHKASSIYNAGYRKTSEIFNEIEKYNRPPLPECEPVYIIKASELAELKKKYTEEGK